MHERNALGPADVSDAQLTLMVAELLGTDPAHTEVNESWTEPVAYDIEAITTAGRHWVCGHARTPDGKVPFRIFVKHVQSWSRHPYFAMVPPEFREVAASGVPWRTEALAYRSDLGDRLPDGLSMPRALGVFDVDEESNAVWLEEVRVVDRPWDLDRFTRAAGLLGRMAVSPAVEPLRDVGQFGWRVRMYVEGRLGTQVLPVLRDDDVWRHPLVCGAFDDTLRRRLMEAAERVPQLIVELESLPITTAHGDACPNNLLAQADSEGFVLIDYGFWGPNPVGFDLGQLLVGDVQIGRRSADDLAEVEETIAAAYIEGIRAEGSDIPVDVVRRAHALALLLFTGLSTLPVEHLDSAPTPELRAMAAERAAIAEFSLDLVETTG